MTDLSVKEKLQQREVTIGSWITLGHSSIAEIMAKAGFEWLTVDLEHTSITLSEAHRLIQVTELSGVAPLVRVGENSPHLISRVMDIGAHGVIIPMVNSREAAESAVAAVKYPPVGTRGVGLGRAQGHGASFKEYKEWVEKESIVIVQIEHVQAVEHLDEILSVDGVDGLLVGPYDLSSSLGIPGLLDDPKMGQVLKRIQEVAAAKRIAAGYHVISPDPKALLAKVKEGFSFIAFSFDAFFLGETCRSSLKAAKEIVFK